MGLVGDIWNGVKTTYEDFTGETARKQQMGEMQRDAPKTFWQLCRNNPSDVYKDACDPKENPYIEQY